MLVAIDMSRHRQGVLIERPDDGCHRRLIVLATKLDYGRLVDELRAMGRSILVGFEATGNYHRTLAHRLLNAGFIRGSSPRSLFFRMREALHTGRDKNDPK